MNEPTPTETPAPKLLPCPFCGSDAEITDESQPDAPRTWFFAWCKNRDECCAWLAHETEEKVAAKWNRRTCMSAEPTTPAPSLGEEVSNEARELVRRLLRVPTVTEMWNIATESLSTARAQDKATLAEKNEEIVRLRDEVFRKPANWFTDSSLETWFPNSAKELIALRAENERLKKYGAGLRLAVEGYDGIKAELEKEVARRKAEVEELIKAFDAIGEAIGTVTLEAASLVMTPTQRMVAAVADLRTRLAQAEKERDGAWTVVEEWKRTSASQTERYSHCCNSADQMRNARDLAEQQRNMYLDDREKLADRLESKCREFDNLNRALATTIIVRNIAEQRVRELEAATYSYGGNQAAAIMEVIALKRDTENLRLASSCPFDTDLAAWVGQLAEDKRRLQSALSCVGNRPMER